jgi:class 3 adenylate cyclase
MTLTLEEALKKISDLEAELRHAKEVARFGMTGTVMANCMGLSAAGLPQRGTVLGVEELIITVDEEGRIAYLNSPMAHFLGIQDRRTTLGKPMAQIDRTRLGEGFFTGIAEGVRGSSQPWIVERECPELDEASLFPGKKSRRPNTPPILHIVATSQRGNTTIVIQNVTELKWLERNFARYVSPEVLLRMYQMSETDFFKPERREITVLFGDLRGFTKMSSEMIPEEVHQTMNSFFAEMVSAVKACGGMVDKFIGDEVMVLFGAPVVQPHHALLGLICGLDMQKRHTRWMQYRLSEAKSAPQLGIGIATGEVVIANVGTSERLEYTALGHTVNLAARLCSDAQGGEILTVPSTYHAAKTALNENGLPQGKIPRLHFESVGLRNYKNVPEPVEVIQLSCAEELRVPC